MKILKSQDKNVYRKQDYYAHRSGLALQRHISTHSNVFNWDCPACMDLLKKHELTIKEECANLKEEEK